MASRKPLMGIENEFKLLRAGEIVNGGSYFPALVDRLPIPYFRKSPICVRLATGGSFYIDGNEPEVTSAPFYVEPGAATSVASNLFLSINSVLVAMKKANEEQHAGLHLNGYSAHYSFTFPEIAPCHREVAYLLATTANPALQLLLENRKSSGIMYRNRENGRLELCGDYIPQPADVIAAVSFQAALLNMIDARLRPGPGLFGRLGSVEKVRKLLRFSLPEPAVPVGSRSGYKLPTPQVIAGGRKALLQMHDAKTGETVKLTAQDLLEYLASLLPSTQDEVLSEGERKLLYDSIEGIRKLPIDANSYPQGYNNVSLVPVDLERARSPLTQALGNAVRPRQVNGGTLTPQQLSWSHVQYQYEHNGSSGELYVPLDDLVAFEALLEQHPALFEPLLRRDLTKRQLQILSQLGFSEPYEILERPADSEQADINNYLNITDIIPHRELRRLEEIVTQYENINSIIFSSFPITKKLIEDIYIFQDKSPIYNEYIHYKLGLPESDFPQQIKNVNKILPSEICPTFNEFSSLENILAAAIYAENKRKIRIRDI